MSWGADVDSTPASKESPLQIEAVPQSTAPETDSDVTWMDDSHAFATERAQELTEWMDGFFGDPVYELEKPESLMRLEWENTWDQQDNSNTRLRLRGKVRLPRLSERLSIIFSGEDGDSTQQSGQSSGQSKLQRKRQLDNH